jgi:hypothetical protein
MLDSQLLAELQEYVATYTNCEFMYLPEEFARQELYHKTKSLKSQAPVAYLPCEYLPGELVGFIENEREPTFSQTLLDLIDKKGMRDADVYKKAGIDRRHFSKIRSRPDYRIRKNTVLALALALKLDCEETEMLLRTAGYSLSPSDISDLVIRFFLEKKIYDLQIVNEALHYFRLKPLSLFNSMYHQS